MAESDSYIKWAAFLLDTLPDHWQVDLVVLESMKTPTQRQIDAAVAHTTWQKKPPRVLSARALASMARSQAPDAVLIAATGPIVEVLTHRVYARLPQRPVLLSGIPGIAVPAGVPVWPYRCLTDLLVIHSLRESRDFVALAEAYGVPGRPAVARLPFLTTATEHVRSQAAISTRRPRVVFAAQAKVPSGLEDRTAVVLAMAALAQNRPDLDVVIKLRGRSDEPQTHREDLNFHDLWLVLAAERGLDPDLLLTDTGPMTEALVGAVGMVSVSSTALLEAMAADIPVLVLADFGVSPQMINIVFEGSGTLGHLTDLAAGKFFTPAPQWLRDNYFHEQKIAGSWIEAMQTLCDDRDAGRLQELHSIVTSEHHLRLQRAEWARLSLPTPVAASLDASRRELIRRRKRLRRRLAR